MAALHRGSEQRKIKTYNEESSHVNDEGFLSYKKNNEIRRGKVLLYNEKHEGYRAVNGQDIYKANRENCGRTSLHQERKAFLTYVVNMFRQKKWSLDVCVGRALLTGTFRRDEIVCTKTLYNYVTKDLLKPIKSIDLPERTRRKQRHRRVVIEARTDGHSIDDRDSWVTSRINHL